MSARPESTYSIRQLCEEFGCTPRALRFYEDKGMLAPTREGLNRIYHNRDRVRLRLILQGKRVGLALNEIGEILDLYDPADGGAQQMACSLKKGRQRILALEAQRVEIESAISDLKHGCDLMERRLKKIRPDLLPPGVDSEQVQAQRLQREPA